MHHTSAIKKNRHRKQPIGNNNRMHNPYKLFYIEINEKKQFKHPRQKKIPKLSKNLSNFQGISIEKKLERCEIFKQYLFVTSLFVTSRTDALMVFTLQHL